MRSEQGGGASACPSSRTTDDVRESPAHATFVPLAGGGRLRRSTTYDPVAGAIDVRRRSAPCRFGLGGASRARRRRCFMTEWAEFVELDWARVESVMADPGRRLRRPKRARCGCSAGRRTELCRHRTPRGPQERLGTAGRPGSHWTEPVDDPPQAAVRSGRYPEYEADSASSEGPHKETRNDPTRRT